MQYKGRWAEQETVRPLFFVRCLRTEGIIANRLKNDYILCPDMRQRSIAGCYQNNVAWLYVSDTQWQARRVLGDRYTS
ncbi:hypothetical protein [Symbiopectobacterium purcellii]|uniref:hypothetical protein n=1 Tax=Symbiopectobacterium purcellii TaxID=2871826 RepID=UPI003F84E824